MAIKTFDSVRSLSEHFDSPVFRDITNDTLLVEDVTHSRWHRYEWTHGQRELTYRESFSGELPIVTQIYPAL